MKTREKFIKVKLGKSQFGLSENPCTGYLWEASCEPEVQMTDFLDNPYYDEEAIGGVGTRYFDLVFDKVGHYVFKAILRRSWDKKDAAEEVTYNIEVENV